MKVIFSGPGERERDRDSELDSDSGLREIRQMKQKFKHTYGCDTPGRYDEATHSPFIGVVCWAVSPGVAEIPDEDIRYTCTDMNGC